LLANEEEKREKSSLVPKKGNQISDTRNPNRRDARIWYGTT
jgi:hypothetical protein